MSGIDSRLPDGWIITEVASVALVTDYVANGSFASLKENVKYSDVEDFAILVRTRDATRNWSGPFVYVSRKAYDFLSKSALIPGDVIVANVGNPGQVFQVPSLGRPITLGPNAVLVRPLLNEIPKDYLAYFIESPLGQVSISGIVTGTAQRKFNKTGFRRSKLLLAPLCEQRRIVRELDLYVSRLGFAKGLLERVRRNLKQYRASVLKSAVEGRLVPTEAELARKENPRLRAGGCALERDSQGKKKEGGSTIPPKRRGQEPRHALRRMASPGLNGTIRRLWKRKL